VLIPKSLGFWEVPNADIVIAVYLASDPYDPNKPHTAVDVLSRSVSAVMAANERRNIEMADM